MTQPPDHTGAGEAHARWQRLDVLLVVALAASAAVWHAFLMTRATNDNFLHMTFAQQWLHGDWPVRDFYDQGWVLQYSLSAAAQLLFGERLLGEAAVVATAWAISTALVYAIVQRLTAIRPIAIVAAILPILAGARGYSYPKGIVYAVAAFLWWDYVRWPTTRRIVACGTWIAMAFYWRPDHGVYVAIGVTLAVVARHGVGRVALSQCAIAAATTIAWVVPFLLYVQLTYGLVPYVQTGLTQAEVEHQAHGTHEWPLIRYASNLLTFEPAERYAPTVGLRWNARSTEIERDEVRRRYELVTVGVDRDGVERVRLSESSIGRLRSLINEPLIDDTAGIERSAGTISEKDWPPSQRRRFSYRLLRLQVLPALDPRSRASEFLAAFFFAFPVTLIMAAPWIARRLPGATRQTVMLFGVFALVVAWAMIRNPFPARVADAVVLSSIAAGLFLSAAWRASQRQVPSVVARAAATALVIGLVATTAVAGEVEGARRWVTGAGSILGELVASPPLAYYMDRPARLSLRFAAYARDCVPENERLLVLWFEPEIYYFSDRLMAQRHAVFAPAWAGLAHEQRAARAKVERFAPTLVLARQSSLNSEARATFPGVVDYVDRHYHVAATVDDDGEQYEIYAPTKRKVTRTFGAQGWPCYTTAESPWSRVGRNR